MTWFQNLKTQAKLALFLGVMLVLLGATAWQGLSAAKAMKANQEATYQLDLRAAVFLQNIVAVRLKYARNTRDGIIETNQAKIAGYVRTMEEEERQLHHDFGEIPNVVKDDKVRALVAEGTALQPEFFEASKAAIAASPQGDSKGDPPVMIAALERSVRVGGQIDDKLEAAVAQLDQLAAERATSSQRQYEHTELTSIALFLVVLVLGIGCTVLISRAIGRPLVDAVRVLENVSEGKLTARLDYDAKDEVGQLAKALNASLESICSTLGSVQEISTEVAAAASELASSAQQISAGSQEQAASLEETAASLEEISSTVKQNTENAQEASHLANSARDAAERGGGVVGSAVSAMNEITRSSKKIADIITTIDEIAFQTNLLALNAAVEAARAGEQGRGFGVVAAEVRTLAQRTGTAAKEIRGLIADSSSKVEVGTNQVNESGKTLEEIVRSVKRVTDMVAEIAAASREQNTGLDQVNTAVTQIDQVTQSNAAQTEELSATAASLSTKSGHLQTLVSAFELGTVSRPAVRPPPVPSAGHTSKVVRIGKPKSAIPAARKVANGGFEEF